MDNYNFEEYVKAKHSGQTRWNGKSYFDEHCVVVSRHAVKLYTDLKIGTVYAYGLELQNIWATGLGHDLLEDTNATFEEIEKLTNKNVADAIHCLTKKQDEKYSEYIIRIKDSGNFIAKLVKLADLECNMSDLKPGSMKDKYELAHYIIKGSLNEAISKT